LPPGNENCWEIVMAKTRRLQRKPVKRSRRSLLSTPASDSLAKVDKTEVSSLVRWEKLGRVAETLAVNLPNENSPTALTLQVAVYEMMRAHLLLAELDGLAQGVIDGDRRAIAALSQNLRDLRRLVPEFQRTGETLMSGDAGVECACVGGAEPPSSAPDSPSLNPDALLRLSVAVNRIERSGLPGSMATLVGLAAFATPMDRLAGAFEIGGEVAALEAWNRLIDAGDFSGRSMMPIILPYLPYAGGLLGVSFVDDGRQPLPLRRN